MSYATTRIIAWAAVVVVAIVIWNIPLRDFPREIYGDAVSDMAAGGLETAIVRAFAWAGAYLILPTVLGVVCTLLLLQQLRRWSRGRLYGVAAAEQQIWVGAMRQAGLSEMDISRVVEATTTLAQAGNGQCELVPVKEAARRIGRSENTVRS